MFVSFILFVSIYWISVSSFFVAKQNYGVSIDGSTQVARNTNDQRCSLCLTMKKAIGPKDVFFCDSCGTEHIRWMGKCPNCNEWNTIKAFKQPKLVSSLKPKIHLSPAKSASNGQWLDLQNEVRQMTLLSEVTDSQEINRLESFSQEINRVLGGGIVPGSVVLLTGEPGIGKSTLLLQLAASIGLSSKKKVVYLSGEENPAQISMRAKRLGIDRSTIYLMCEMNIDQVIAGIPQLETLPSLIIVDSIQTIFTDSSSGSIGSVSQIRESTSRIIQFAKSNQVPVILIGHVTKTGEVAGPKVLEHMVDTVLSLEGSDKFDYRMIRCEKNRFGTISEVGVFSMSEVGLVDVNNPSELFLTESVLKEPQEGAAVVITLEGSRCLLAEVQCLVGNAPFQPQANMKFSAKRASDGFPIQRLLLLCAVLEKRLKLRLASRDVYINIVGGLSLSEPSADLAISMAIISSLLSIPVYPATAFIGEVGLGGEIRGGKRIEQRIMEAVKLGFRRIILPKAAIRSSSSKAIDLLKGKEGNGYELFPCDHLEEASEKGLMLQGKTWKQMMYERNSYRKKKTGHLREIRNEDDKSGKEIEVDWDDMMTTVDEE